MIMASEASENCRASRLVAAHAAGGGAEEAGRGSASAPTATHVAAGVAPVPDCGADQGGVGDMTCPAAGVANSDGTQQPPFWIIRSSMSMARARSGSARHRRSV